VGHSKLYCTIRMVLMWVMLLIVKDDVDVDVGNSWKKESHHAKA